MPTRQWFFEDQNFEFLTLIVLGSVAHRMAEVGEVLAAISAVEDGDSQSWFDGWMRTGERVEAVARDAEAKGHSQTARDAYLRASMYMGTAFFNILGSRQAAQKVEVWKRHRANADAAFRLWPTPTEKVAIPYETTTLEGYFFSGGAGRRPLLIVNNGSDGTVVEMLPYCLEEAVKRGYHALTFDGPGQGQALYLQGLYVRHDWERVITPVVDWALARADVNADRIALFGCSMGGYCVARAAAFEHRLAALIADPGVVRVDTSARAGFPDELMELYRAGQRGQFDGIVKGMAEKNPRLAAIGAKQMEPYGTDSAFDILTALERWDLADVAGQVTCPTLITDPDDEQFWPGQSRQLYDLLTAPKTLVPFTAAEGANWHCEPVAPVVRSHRVLDWLDQTLKLASATAPTASCETAVAGEYSSASKSEGVGRNPQAVWAAPAVMPPPAEHPRRWAALVVLCAAALIINVDNTILNVALPTLVRSLHATSSELQWVVDSYALVFAGLLLVGGSLADRLGRKRFFLIGLTVFAAGSIGAAMSGSADLLIAWRALMGAGAALTIPASLSIINDIFRDPAQRAKAIGAWAATIGLGIAIGPIAGGLLLAEFWWGSIFLVNVPIVIAAFAAAMVLLPDSKNPAADRPDRAGAALSIAGLGLLLWAIIEGPTKGWSSASVVGVGALSVAALSGFIAWEAHTDHPMLSLVFFRDRGFSIAAASECLGIFGLMGVLFLQTQFLQFDLGYSPLQAGVRILPAAGMICLTAPLSPIIARRIGIKLVVAAGLAAIAGGLWQIAAVSTPAATYEAVLTGMLLIGVGAGLLLPTATNSVVGSVPQGDSGIGSATNTVALQVGGALGVAVIGSAMLTRYQSHMTAALAGRRVPAAATHTIIGSLGGALTVAGSVGGSTGAILAHAARGAFMSGMKVSLVVGALVALAGAVLALTRLPSRTPQPSPDPSTGNQRAPRPVRFSDQHKLVKR